jgi:hypothetical protein
MSWGQTVPKHIFGSHNLYILHADKKKVILCFCMILRYFKTLKYANIYDFLFFSTKKLKNTDHVQGTLKTEILKKIPQNKRI